MELRFPKKIVITSYTFDITYNPEQDGSRFSYPDATITIGTMSLKNDKNYIFSDICHEISEIIHIALGYRYNDYTANNNYKFFLTHKEFTAHNLIFAKAIQKFIK